MAGAHAGRPRADRLGPHDAGQARRPVEGGGGTGSVKSPSRPGAACGRTGCRDHLDHASMKLPRISTARPRARRRAPRAAGPHRMALHVAQDHAQPLGQSRWKPKSLEQRTVVYRRGCGRIASAGGDSQRGARRAIVPATPARKAEPAIAGDDHDEVEAIVEAREAEELGVQRGDPAYRAKRRTAMPSAMPGGTMTDTSFEIVQGDLERRVAERLEDGDLLALQPDEPADARLAREMRRPPGRSSGGISASAGALDLVRQQLVRDLLGRARARRRPP